MKWIVNNPDGYATNLKEFAGSNLTLVNSSATDVYYDVTAGGGPLNSTAPGTVPLGTKLAANGGLVQFFDAPHDLWVRAATQTTLDVQADAFSAKPQKQTVVAGNALLIESKLSKKTPKKFLVGALVFLFFAFSASAQLTRQGGEIGVPYAGYNAFILTSVPVNPNLLTGSGLNTFILSVTPPSNAVKLYITNDTANACAALTVSMASTGNANLSSFNNNLSAWQSVLIQSGTGGITTSVAVSLPASGTVTITSTPIVASKLAIFIVLSAGCNTTTIDVQASFGSFIPATQSVQGLVPTGQSGASINPLIDGGLDPSNFVQPLKVCSASSATGCSGGNGFDLGFGANGNSVSSIGTSGVTSANSSAAPLAVINYGIRSINSGGLMQTGATSGGSTGVAVGDNPPGLFVSDTGFFHLYQSIVVSSTQVQPLFGLGNTLALSQEGSAAFSSCYVQATVQNTAGTTPTLDLFFQTSIDGSNWNDRIHFAQFTTGTNTQFAGIAASAGITPANISTGALAAATKVDGPIGTYARFSFVLGGTTPSYTVTAGASCK